MRPEKHARDSDRGNAWRDLEESLLRLVDALKSNPAGLAEPQLQQAQAELTRVARRTAQAILAGRAGTDPVHDGEDAAQDLCVALLTGYQRIDPARGAFPYLVRTLRNLCLRIANRNRRRQSLPAQEQPAEWDDNPVKQAGAAERERDVHASLSGLPEDRRQLLHLRYWQNLSAREIAAATNSTESAVNTRLHRTRSELREPLEQQGYEAHEFGRARKRAADQKS